MWVWSLGGEDPLEEEMATHSSILAWEIPWTGKPVGLQSMGLQRVKHNRVTKPSHIIHTHTCNTCIHMYSFTVAEVYPRPGALKAHGEIVWFERCSLGIHTYERKEEAIFFRGQGKTGIGRPPSTQRSTQEWVLLVRVVWHQLEKIDVLGLLYPWVTHAQGRLHSL